MTTTSARRLGAWPVGFAGATAALGAVAFAPVPVWAFDVWTGHLLGGAAAGLITFPLCLVLGWLATRRPGWDRTTPDRRGATAMLLLFVLGQAVAVALASDRWNALVLGGICLPPAIFAWIWGTCGLHRATSLSMPVLFGWFAIPWELFLREADLRLQAWTADIALQSLNLFGYGLRYWNDHTIYTWDFHLIVNETCSGVNMLITLAMYTAIFGWATQRNLWNRVALMVLVVPLSLFANGMRVAFIYLLGHHGDQALAMGPWHSYSAYVIFMPVFWFLYVTGRALQRRWPAARRGSRAPTSPPSGRTASSPS